MRMTDLHIRVHGYSLVQVEAAMPWCYTIGLQESFGHSELVACGLEMSFEVELIRTVAGMVTTGGVDYVRLAELEIGLAPVFDPVRADPRFVDLVRRLGLPSRPPPSPAV